jgi:hypothetical protein
MPLQPCFVPGIEDPGISTPHITLLYGFEPTAEEEERVRIPIVDEHRIDPFGWRNAG